MIEFIKRRWKLLTTILLVLVLGGAFLANRSANRASAAGAYQTAKIEKGNLVATVGATGTVRSNQSSDLAWQTNGTVANVNVKVGDFVHSGDELAVLDKRTVPQNVILAEADLVDAQKSLEDVLQSGTAAAQAKIKLDDAQDALDKAKDYRKSLNEKVTYEKVTFEYDKTLGRKIPKKTTYKHYADEETIANADADLALKQAEYDDALREYNRLKDGPNQDDVAAAEARVAAAQATLDMAHITAPFDGTVTSVEPMPGDQVSAGMPAFRLDDLSSMLVDVELSEVDINSVQVGQAVTLTFDAIVDKEYQGEVVKVGHVGNQSDGVVNFTVTVKLTDMDEQVKPGMTAAVTIKVKELKDVLLVPNRAVRIVDGKQKVVIQKEDGSTQAVDIRLGSSADTSSVVAGGDLKEGDVVILNPTAEMLGQNPFMGGPGR